MYKEVSLHPIHWIEELTSRVYSKLKKSGDTGYTYKDQGTMLLHLSPSNASENFLLIHVYNHPLLSLFPLPSLLSLLLLVFLAMRDIRQLHTLSNVIFNLLQIPGCIPFRI